MSASATIPAFHVVIPARYGSSRLPGKPLADLAGRPMVSRVVERALAAGAVTVVVATDDDRVAAAVEQDGCRVLMTRADHPSGTDRIAEVAQQLGWGADELVVNVQGDEPLIPPAVIGQVAALLADAEAAAAATLCEPIRRREDLFDPNLVKVVRSDAGLALYFSRAPIPWARDAFGDTDGPLPDGSHWWRHIGIYGYRVRTLERFVTLPPGQLERIESLEQLRLLQAGLDLVVAPACADVPGGVDTPADLARVRRLMGG